MRLDLAMVVSAMAFLIFACCQTHKHCEMQASCIAATQARVHFCFIQHHHQQCKAPALNSVKGDEKMRLGETIQRALQKALMDGTWGAR